MDVESLLIREDLTPSSRGYKNYQKLSALVNALRGRELGPGVTQALNTSISGLNAMESSHPAFAKTCGQTYRKTLNRVVKECQLVPRNYYRTLWTGMGMAAIGIPIGAALGTSLKNMAFLGVGIPIGLAAGVGIGTAMDKKAEASGIGESGSRAP